MHLKKENHTFLDNVSFIKFLNSLVLILFSFLIILKIKLF